MIYKIEHTQTVAGLFEHWQETIIWSCLDRIMGSIYADNIQNPKSAMAVLGDFCFFTGVPNPELVAFKQKEAIPDFTPDFIIMIPQTPQWSDLI